MTIAITSSGISLDGPLVAGERVGVSVSGLSLAAEDKPTLALLARFPDALLASVELAESETAGTWTGELDTATKQTALFFATARADERRDAALELVAGRVSLARLTVPMANSALCPKPDGSPFASPVYVPVPGPPGQGGDPYDQAPEMDGEASAGTADEYARGDHRHPTDSSRASAVDVTVIQNVIPSTATPSNKLATASDLSGKANTADLATVATTGAYSDLSGTPSLANVATTGSGSDVSLTIGENNTDVQTWASGADQFIATLPSGSDILSQQGVSGNVYKGSIPTDVLTTPPRINGDSLALAKSLAAEFSENDTYAVGDYVTREGLLYKCTTAVATAGAWNAENWTAVAVTAFVQAEARYALTAKTPSVSGTAATVACEDRAINDFTVATGITSLAITPPAAVTGRARDFFCRVTLTDSSLPTVTLSGATIDIGASEVAGMTQGVNLLMFTEIASGHWLASRRSAS